MANDPSGHASLTVSCQPTLKKVAGSASVLAVLGGENYFHWMVHLLPRVQLLRDAGHNLDRIDQFIVNRISNQFQVQTLIELGVPQDRIIETSASMHILVERLYIPARPSRMSDMPRWVCEFLRSRFLKELSTRPKLPKRIYIARTNVNHRWVENQYEVEGFLSSMGFETIGLESLAVTEQAQLFANAEVIVAPHGAGLTNLVFSRPGTTVIEIFTPRYINACYWALSNLVSARYFFVLGKGEKPKDGKVKVFDLLDNIIVDLDALRSTLVFANVT